MITIEDLTRNPGKFIKTFLPYIQAIAANGNPFIINEGATIINEFQMTWGGGNARNTNNFFTRSPQLSNTAFPEMKNASEASVNVNFRTTLNSMNMSDSNSHIEFYAFVNLFYALVDPLSYFLDEPSYYDFACPPYPSPCGSGMNAFSQRAGAYMIAQTPGDGTSFDFISRKGDAETPAETVINFNTVDINICCPECGCLENRYFTLYTTTDQITVWYNAGTGVLPIVGGATKSIEVDISASINAYDIKVATDFAIDNDGDYAALNDNCCPDCPCGFSSQYVAAVNGDVTDAIDGKDGFSIASKTMKASDGSTLIEGLDTDAKWQNAHNTLRVPYEAALGGNLKYLLNIPSIPGIFLQTTSLGVLSQMPYNAPGLVTGAGRSNFRTPVID